MGRGSSGLSARSASGGSQSGSDLLLKGEPESKYIYYDKWANRYEIDAYDAKAEGDTLIFDYAADKDWDNERSSSKRRYLTVTVKNGIIDGEPVNIDLDKAKYVEGIAPARDDRTMSRTQRMLQNKGFSYNSTKDKWEKNYKGYEKQGTHLVVDHTVPSDLSGITTIKTPYGIDTSAIKKAGFSWDREAKVWKKK